MALIISRPDYQQQLHLWIWSFTSMCQYALVDPEVSEQVKNSIFRQQRYLTEELVVSSLFDSKLSNDIRASIANTLLQTQKPATYPPAKPVFRNDILEGVDPGLQSFVGPRSWLLFRLLGYENNHEWLTQLPAEWPKYQEYIEMNDVVYTLEVVNDNAEREIKNVQEYAMSSLDGELLQNIVIVSNSHRAEIASFLKRDTLMGLNFAGIKFRGWRPQNSNISRGFNFADGLLSDFSRISRMGTPDFWCTQSLKMKSFWDCLCHQHQQMMMEGRKQRNPPYRKRN